MPKVGSCSRASRAAAGATRCASPRVSVRARSTATQSQHASKGKRRRAHAPVSASENPVVPAQEPQSIPVTEQPSQPEVQLSPQFIETLITRVADEVSRRLSPAEKPASLPPNLPSALQEVPVHTANGQSSPPTEAADVIANSVVQGSLANVSTTLTGLVPSTSGGSPPVLGQFFLSLGLPVDARVTDKLWGKIWKDDFIDFGSLLVNPVLANRFQLTVQNAESGPLPSLCIEPIAKTKKVESIESWLSSFHIFVGIYTKRFPHEAPALMKYCKTIQDLAGKGHNWKFYDENFRFLRQTHHSALLWDRIHDELWLKSHQVTPPKPLQPLSTGRLPGKADTTPKG